MTARTGSLAPTAAGLREAGGNLALSALYGLFAAAHAQAWLREPRASLALAVVVEGAVAVLALARARAGRTSATAWDWATTLGGTLAPLLLRPAAEGQDHPLGQALQLAGTALALAAILSLRRSFGLLPALRPLRVGGAYRLVRHPIYAAYTLQNVGYLLSHRSAANLAAVLVAFGFQLLRIRNEERLLATQPEYQAYARRTRWRLLPPVY